MGESVVWLNGEFVERGNARVSAFDAGLQHGVGLFETMLAVDGAVFRLDAHMARIADSARVLGLSDKLRGKALGEAIRACAQRAGFKRARIRATVTGGDLNMLAERRGDGGGGAADPTVLIDVQPATQYPDEMFERGVSVVIAQWRVNPLDPFEGHKTVRYWPRLRELQMAATKQAGEAITLQVSNHVTGGCVSNVFAVKDGVLVTPMARGEDVSNAETPLPSPVLPGITRSVVIEWAKSVGIQVERRLCAVSDLLDADEVFLTNSSWGVLPVVRIEAEMIGDGKPGAVTGRARGHWVEVTVGETGLG